MAEAVFIPADVTEPLSRLEIENLDDYQKAVGGYIQVVYRDNLAVYLNEEGKLQGLPVNARATDFLKGYLHPGDYIAGNALVFQANLETGVDDDCPRLMLEMT